MWENKLWYQRETCRNHVGCKPPLSISLLFTPTKYRNRLFALCLGYFILVALLGGLNLARVGEYDMVVKRCIALIVYMISGARVCMYGFTKTAAPRDYTG